MTPIIAANWLNISINLLLVIHVAVCLLLALVVLMQRPKQEGLGAAFGAGLTDQAFGARTTDVLQKGTIYLGTLFFVITLVLAILIGKRQSNNPTIIDDVVKTEEPATAEIAELPESDKPAVKMPEKADDAKTSVPLTAPTKVTPPAETPATPAEAPAEKPAAPVKEPATTPAGSQ
jgi:preprotein translocase subunit SecG